MMLCFARLKWSAVLRRPCVAGCVRQGPSPSRPERTAAAIVLVGAAAARLAVLNTVYQPCTT